MTNFKNGNCDIEDLRPMLYAASNDKDNSKCCRQKGLLKKPYDICEPFCNPGSANWPEKPQLKYFRCLNKLNDFLNCHWASCRP